MLPVVGTRLHVHFQNLTKRVEIFVVNILRTQNGCDRPRANWVKFQDCAENN
jgi:hypothetical protein